jgi:signal transduction histidine kinase
MRQRVEHINGQLHLSQNPTHFLIHVVLPKKDSDTIRHPR